MANSRTAGAFSEIIKVANECLEKFAEFVRSQEADGFLKLGDRYPDRQEFTVGLQSFVRLLKVSISSLNDVHYFLVTKEIVISNDDYCQRKLIHKPTLDIRGNWDFLKFVTDSKQVSEYRDWEVDYLFNFPREYFYELYKQL